jgi:hypothetical protein
MTSGPEQVVIAFRFECCSEPSVGPTPEARGSALCDGRSVARNYFDALSGS